MKFKVKVYNCFISDEELIADLKHAAKLNCKKTLTQKEYSACGKYSPCTYKARFGNWRLALQKAGLKPKVRIRFNGGDMTAELKRAAKKLKQDTITTTQFEKTGRISFRSVIRVFGSWNNALKSAGLKPSQNRNVSLNSLFKNLERVWLSLGRQPVYTDMVKPLSEYSGGVYKSRFGTWLKALAEFEKYINADKSLRAKLLSRGNKKRVHRTTRTISYRMRYIILNRDRYRCRVCGGSPSDDIKVKLHVDHIIPWSKGGESILSNLQTLCLECNTGKGAS